MNTDIVMLDVTFDVVLQTSNIEETIKNFNEVSTTSKIVNAPKENKFTFKIFEASLHNMTAIMKNIKKNFRKINVDFQFA